MDNEELTQNNFNQDISSWTPEELLKALTYDFERHSNSIKGWASVLSEGYTEELIKQVIQSLHWNADQMKRLIDDTREYLNKRSEK
ncbi:MAG: hypothetical protein ABIU06_11925 [Anaerolineales bacterium]